MENLEMFARSRNQVHGEECTGLEAMERISVDGLYSWEGVKGTQKTKMIDQSIRSFSTHSGEITNHLALNMIINGKTQMLSLMFFFWADSLSSWQRLLSCCLDCIGW